jgi:GT2 family glycosyltransferase
MLLSVVVVNWNSKDDLLACLASLEAQTHQDIEVIVIDNGSEDGSVEAARTRFPSYRILPQGQNLGFAEACNRGIGASSGPWVAMLNNDAVADPNWAAALVIAAEGAPEACGMLQSAMFFLHDPNTVNSMGLYLTRTGGAIDRFEGSTRRAFSAEEIFCPTGGACAYRRAMLDRIKLEVGYYDREYFMYSEDFDLGWRAQLAGWSAQLVPESFVLHRFHGSTVRRGRSFFVVHTRLNRLRTLLKNSSWPFFLQTLHHTLFELGELICYGRWRAAVQVPKAVRHSLQQRAAVRAMSTVSRRALEKRWVGRVDGVARNTH